MQTFSVKPGMRLSFSDIKNIFFNISADNEQWLLVPADIDTFSLSDCEEMSPIMGPDSLAR